MTNQARLTLTNLKANGNWRGSLLSMPTSGGVGLKPTTSKRGKIKWQTIAR